MIHSPKHCAEWRNAVDTQTSSYLQLIHQRQMLTWCSPGWTDLTSVVTTSLPLSIKAEVCSHIVNPVTAGRKE